MRVVQIREPNAPLELVERPMPEPGPREMRLYPNGNLAAHILGGTAFGAEGVNSAQVMM